MKTFTTIAVVASFLAVAPAYAHSHMSTPSKAGTAARTWARSAEAGTAALVWARLAKAGTERTPAI